jgi:NCAIR mutase (PurE)-related protein
MIMNTDSLSPSEKNRAQIDEIIYSKVYDQENGSQIMKVIVNVTNMQLFCLTFKIEEIKKKKIFTVDSLQSGSVNMTLFEDAFSPKYARVIPDWDVLVILSAELANEEEA